MWYKLLADAVVLLHLLWIVFLFIGAWWGVRYKAVRLVHIGGLVFAVSMQVFGWYCPLTHLEVWLRAKHNPALSYSGSFIAHYTERLIYADLSPLLIFIVTVILAGVNGAVYARALRR